MSVLKVILAGLIGGLVGAAAWAAVAHFMSMELGILAWGIGALVGVSMRFANDGDGNVLLGVLAIVISIASIGAGKFGGAYLDMNTYLNEIDTQVDVDHVQLQLADKLVEEYQFAGKPVKWPDPTMTVEEAIEQADYPPELWQDMIKRWNAMSPQEQNLRIEEARDEFRNEIGDNRVQIISHFVVDGLNFFDILWGILAVISAFKLAGMEE